MRLPALKPRVGAPNERVAARPRNATASTSAELAVAGPSSTATGTAARDAVRRPDAQLRVVAEAGLAVAVPDGDAPAVGIDGGRELAFAEQRTQARQHRPEVAAGVLPQIDDPAANSGFVNGLNGILQRLGELDLLQRRPAGEPRHLEIAESRRAAGRCGAVGGAPVRAFETAVVASARVAAALCR